MKNPLLKLARSAVSYLPSPSLLPLRRLSDLGSFGRPHEEDFLCFGFLPPAEQVFLDIGANRGQSIRSIGIAVDRVRTIAVEPNPVLAAALSKMALPGVEMVHNVALSDTDSGELMLHVPRYGNTLYDTRAASSPDQAAAFLDKEWFAFFDPKRSGVETFSAPMTTVDLLEVEPTIVKVDVEGADLAVVKGAWNTLTTHRPLLLIEEPVAQTVEELRTLDYRPFRFTGDALVLNDTTGLNTFFLTAHHEELFRQGGLRLPRAAQSGD